MRTCSVEGCDRKHYAKGLCNVHWQRMSRTGSFTIEQAERGDPVAFLLQALKFKDKKSCLTWPYALDAHGYGRLRYNGKPRPAHRIVCRKVHGKAPSKLHLACHTCGNGHLACINPHHVYWGTHATNAEDRVQDGRQLIGVNNTHAKLNDAKVRKVLRFLARGLSYREIGRKFGVSHATIRGIDLGDTWKHIERSHV